MTEQQEQQQSEPLPAGVDEAAFCRALGIDPDHVKAGSIGIEMKAGQAVLTFTSIYGVPARMLGLAFMASGPAEEMPPPPPEPQDRKAPSPRKAAAAKKAPAKKAAAKKGGRAA